MAEDDRRSSWLRAPALKQAVDRRSSILGVDLFAGAGGFSQAAINAGVSIVAAVENDRHACASYRANFVDNQALPPKLFDQDVLELSPEEVIQEIPILSSHGCDILLGGPPCQGFSTHRIKGAGIGDPRNQLLIRYFDYVAALKPKVFLVENVPGLLWPRHEEFLQRFRDLTIENGYTLLGPEKLNSRDFGVPQSRQRVFMLGIRGDTSLSMAWPPEPSHRPIYSDDDGRPEWQTASVAFEKPLRSDDACAVHMKHTKALIEYFEKIPLNGGSRSDVNDRVLPCHKDHNGHKDVYGRIDPTRPSPTMTAACINPSKGRFVHPTEPHGITLRHAARLQSFPDSFVFKGGLMAGGAQIGNAVPVRMGEALIRPIVEAMKVHCV